MSEDTIEIDDVYEGFIERALETGCVWGLESDDGWALCASARSQKVRVMPLWSCPEIVEIHCRDEWSSYTSVPISLEELLDEWLPGMHHDVLLVGIDWNEELEGEEREPLDLLEDFDKAALGR